MTGHCIPSNLRLIAALNNYSHRPRRTHNVLFKDPSFRSPEVDGARFLTAEIKPTCSADR